MSGDDDAWFYLPPANETLEWQPNEDMHAMDLDEGNAFLPPPPPPLPPPPKKAHTDHAPIPATWCADDRVDWDEDDEWKATYAPSLTESGECASPQSLEQVSKPCLARNEELPGLISPFEGIREQHGILLRSASALRLNLLRLKEASAEDVSALLLKRQCIEHEAYLDMAKWTGNMVGWMVRATEAVVPPGAREKAVLEESQEKLDYILSLNHPEREKTRAMREEPEPEPKKTEKKTTDKKEHAKEGEPRMRGSPPSGRRMPRPSIVVHVVPNAQKRSKLAAHH